MDNPKKEDNETVILLSKDDQPSSHDGTQTDQTNTKNDASTNNDQTAPSANRLKYGRVVILLENPILPEETIANTPSMADGLEPMVENDLRITGCKLIQISGILLRLPQVCYYVYVYYY